ncbi:MAG: 23S rRNA (cytidine1920-2'-O)/16S rRNA (cytidine1409-2'-O)-methyltransferase [Cellvibrionaceae bacterium]|jgi:23S rRNA (cytidine1920-2'-O)/16S rRNA (cytidine1409-2'-O)-methyltransferase
MTRKERKRLDIALTEQGLVKSRAQAKGMIMAREVMINGEIVDRAGAAVQDTDVLSLVNVMPWVSRGGYKLSGAIQAFDVNPLGRICADVGACTGGFTDVLLQAGAQKIYSIDVGYGQLDWKLRQDDRVVVMERTNARYIESLDDPIELVAIDVSFISLKIILKAVIKWLDQATDATPEVVALIKPQFEASRPQVGKGGVIRDDEIRRDVVLNVLNWMRENGWSIQGLVCSQIQGADGNIEFLVWLKPLHAINNPIETQPLEWYDTAIITAL